MHAKILVSLVLGMFIGSAANAQSFADEEFTDDDFAQFFGLIVDGKITREKMNQRCAKEIVGFTFAGKDLVHDGDLARVDYNETGLKASVDGRTLRSRHFNATFGEWTGAVFKPLCPGMWVISVDFSTAPDPADAEEKMADDVRLHLYVRRGKEDRPGTSIMQASTAGEGLRGNGHLTIALPLHTGDEVSTYSAAIGSAQKRVLERVTFTAYKTGHLEKYVKEFDVDAWNADLEALQHDQTNGFRGE
jgi:hypothetical protein